MNQKWRLRTRSDANLEDGLQTAVLELSRMGVQSPSAWSDRGAVGMICNTCATPQQLEDPLMVNSESSVATTGKVRRNQVRNCTIKDAGERKVTLGSSFFETCRKGIKTAVFLREHYSSDISDQEFEDC